MGVFDEAGDVDDEGGPDAGVEDGADSLRPLLIRSQAFCTAFRHRCLASLVVPSSKASCSWLFCRFAPLSRATYLPKG